MDATGTFSPRRDEIAAIGNALRGWSDVCGLGPEYFVPPAVENELYDMMVTGERPGQASRAALARARARVANFFALTSKPERPFTPATAADFHTDTDTFLCQLAEQAQIWLSGTFRSLDFSLPERRIYFRLVAKSAPVLFIMGFTDAIPHSGQVSRLTAAMADRLGGRHAEVLQAAIVGWLHDPKFHPSIDLEKQNLATHPVNASALAHLLFRDAEINDALGRYFHGNSDKLQDFMAGAVDALSINNDSRFVQMMVILPAFTLRVGELYGQAVADQFQAVIERRLESASRGIAPAELPDHLHGALSQIRLDSGFRGLSLHGWLKALENCAVQTTDAQALFHRLLDGDEVLTPEKTARLRSELAALPGAILRVDVKASTLLHHHQEVRPSGRLCAEALVIADPMMLSPHKVAAAYDKSISARLGEFARSFDDNIALLPVGARAVGARWQRAVYLSLLAAADSLTGSARLAAFRLKNAGATVDEDIACLRACVLEPETWGAFASAAGQPAKNADVQKALAALEAAYVAVVSQYRRAVYQSPDDAALDKFFPEF